MYERNAPTIRIAAAQLSLQIGSVGVNRATARAAIDTAAAAGTQLLVLPELTPSGYVFADADEARGLAEPADGPTMTEWQDLSSQHALILVAGFCELGADGLLYNSATLIDHGRVRAIYRKAHLWDRENLVFEPGRAAAPVVQTSLDVKVAVMVCYDLEFAEWTRAAAVAGADIVAAPTNWPAALVPPGERPLVVANVQVAAAANRMWVIAADRCGVERGVDWVGGSVIAGPDGYPVAGPSTLAQPALLTATIEVAKARNKRLNEHNDALGDRRTDLY